MARQLILKIKDKEFPLELVKLDRKKLYGWVDKEVLDGDGNKCVAASLDSTSMKIIPKGETALGILTEDGEWLSRTELTAVNSDGDPAQIVPSSFDASIDLLESVTVEEYLNYMIKNVYTFSGEGEKEIADLIKGGPIYTFIFNYRADYEGTPAFLIESEGKVYLTIGDKADFEFVAKDKVSNQVFDDESSDIEDDDDLDFGMM